MDAIVESAFPVFMFIVKANNESLQVAVRKMLSSLRYSNFIQNNWPRGNISNVISSHGWLEAYEYGLRGSSGV